MRNQGHVEWNRRCNKKSKQFKVGMAIETCGVELATIVKINGDDIRYARIAGRYPAGCEGSCSVMNCGPVILSPSELERRLEFFKKDGHKGLLHRYYREDCGMTDEQIQELERSNKDDPVVLQ